MSQSLEAATKKLKGKSLKEAEHVIEAFTLIAEAAEGKGKEHDAKRKKWVDDDEIGDLIIKGMRAHKEDDQVQVKAFEALKSLCLTASNATALIKIRADKMVMDTMESLINNEKVQEVGCNAIEKLASLSENQIQLFKNKAADSVLTAMIKHLQNASVQQSGFVAFQSLSVPAENKLKLMKLGVADAIINALFQHKQNENIQKNGCKALESLLSSDEARFEAIKRGADLRISELYESFGTADLKSLEHASAARRAIRKVQEAIREAEKNDIDKANQARREFLKKNNFAIPEKVDVKLKENGSKPKSELENYITSPQVDGPYASRSVRDLFNNDVPLIFSQLSYNSDGVVKEIEKYEVALKVERFGNKLKAIEESTKNLSANDIIEKIKGIVEQCNKVDELDAQLNRNTASLNDEEKKARTKERDEERKKVIDSYSALKFSLDKCNSLNTVDNWAEFQNLKNELRIGESSKKLSMAFASSSSTSSMDVSESQYSEDWISKCDEIIQNIKASMNTMKQASENIHGSINDLETCIKNGMREISQRYESFLQKEKKLKETFNPVNTIENQYASLIQKQINLFNKKKKIDELERDIKRKEEEIKTVKLNNLKYEGEIVKKENDESQKQEREKLGMQIKEGDIKLKMLNDELDTLKEHLNEANKDTNGNSSISAFHSSFSTHNSSNGLHSKDLIKIPTTLQQIRPDRCELMESIGDGGNSNVFKLKTRKRGSTENEFAAFKRFNFITSSTSPDDIEKAEKEIKFLSELEHPNIVKIIGAIGDPDAKDENKRLMGIGIVMEYCENGSLRSLLNKNNNKLDIRSIGIHLLLGAAQGLEYLHTHTPTPIAHGDIKSDNILVDGDYTAKLCDFGISKLVYSANSAPTVVAGKGVGGTVVYQAPETFNGPLELKSDVYSFGCVILEMLTGERPWNRVGNNFASIVTKILINEEKHDYSKITTEAMRDCSELVELMKRCLDYNKDKRPTIKEVRMKLEMIINPLKGFSSHYDM